MITILRKKRWSPFIVGSLIGLLTVSAYYFLGSFIGVSSAFSTIMYWLLYITDQHYLQQSTYLNTLNSSIKDVFQVAIIFGIIIGSFVATFFSKSFVTTPVPLLWQKNFGPSFTRRALAAFSGGMLVMIGARIAGGCTSGKAIASGLQLLVPAWLFIACLFTTGIIVSFLLYKK